jgi:hypothetical protein
VVVDACVVGSVDGFVTVVDSVVNATVVVEVVGIVVVCVVAGFWVVETTKVVCAVVVVSTVVCASDVTGIVVVCGADVVGTKECLICIVYLTETLHNSRKKQCRKNIIWSICLY